jgi:hypothetical protein
MGNSKKELYEIKGDMKSGFTSEVDLTRTALGHPAIRYRDRITEADVYSMGDELFIHMHCPRCTGTLRITNKMKRIDFRREDSGGGRIDISPFACTWPGCGLQVVVKDNRMFDGRWVNGDFVVT